MTLAQVWATIAMVASLIATWAGLIIAVALLLPRQTRKAEAATTASPLRSFLVGILMVIPLTISTIVLRAPVGGLRLLAFISLVCIGAALAIGASGMALLMGKRINEMSETRPGFASLVRGSIAFSLAMGFPLIGWFVFLPVSLVLSLGAGTIAIVRSLRSDLIPGSKPEYDVLEQHGAI